MFLFHLFCRLFFISFVNYFQWVTSKEAIHEEDRRVVALGERYIGVASILTSSPFAYSLHYSHGAARAAASSLGIYSFGCCWKRNEACFDECNFCSAEWSPSKKLAPQSSNKADGNSS
ncbi:hypothetical protein Bca101_058662 [Brassica carinata]